MAIDDTDAATEGGPAITGNVITGVGSDGNPAGQDTPLGDTPTTITAASQNGNAITVNAVGAPSPVAFTTAAGGSLTLYANGSYSYTPPAQGMVGSDGLTETFNYTLTDVDGDKDAANLVISVSNTLVPEPPENQPGISHVVVLLSDGRLIKIEGYTGTMSDYEHPTRFFSAIEDQYGQNGAEVVSYVVKAGDNYWTPAYVELPSETSIESYLGINVSMNGQSQTIAAGDTVTYRSTAGSDNLVGTNSNDATLNGGSGNDVIHGGDGNDTIQGGLGDDFIHGGDGTDKLSGNDGIDTLRGGAADDTLAGGVGADTFVWKLADVGSTQAHAKDIVTDFSGGAEGDRLDLSSVLDVNHSLTATADVNGKLVLQIHEGDPNQTDNIVQEITLSNISVGADDPTTILNSLKPYIEGF